MDLIVELLNFFHIPNLQVNWSRRVGVLTILSLERRMIMDTETISWLNSATERLIFETGFAGINYGFFLDIGDVSPGQVENFPETPPSWLSPNSGEAWTHMFKYAPPTLTAQARREKYCYGDDGVLVGEVKLRDEIHVRLNRAYLLRSIDFRTSDLLVFVKPVFIFEDGSIVILWRIIKEFPVPATSGQDLADGQRC